MSRTELIDSLKATPFAQISKQANLSELRSYVNTLDLNDYAVSHCLNNVDSSTLIKAYAVALCTQRALYNLVDPETGQIARNLAVSKRAGAFFTPPDIALNMAETLLQGKPTIRLAVEPASGTAMLSSALIALAKNKDTKIEKLEVWEVDPYLAKISASVLKRVFRDLELPENFLVRTGDALELATSGQHRPDAIILNPPYGRIKYLKSEATNAETRAHNTGSAQADGEEWAQMMKLRYSKLAKKLGLRTTSLDHQRIFLAACFKALATDGRMVAITPSSWTSGKQSRDIRQLLFANRSVSSIRLLSEDTKLFETVNQPTAIAAMDASIRHSTINVTVTSARQMLDDQYLVDYEEIVGAKNPDFSLTLVNHQQHSAFNKVKEFPTLSASSVKNARGELDLSMDGWMLDKRAKNPVVRGDQLERFMLNTQVTSRRTATISDDGLRDIKNRPKWLDVERDRVAGRQVAYMGKRRRMTFAHVPSGTILTNSCNYLVASDKVTHFALLAFLNSTPAEWWFRLRSSNNHISNAELANLPWVLDDQKLVAALAKLGEFRSSTSIEASAELNTRVETLIDALICFGFGLDENEARSVCRTADDSRTEIAVGAMVKWLHTWGIPDHLSGPSGFLQHNLNTLSDLDMRMIRSIPIGGNWQNIPLDVPSERLKQIREMSAARGVVRTTYYGRLRPEQPSYTVATYYNRPGNGTNIHPFEDRTISDREAARLQSFPDYYSFIGREGAVRKQIGNAVPPLLGAAVARHIQSSLQINGPAVDLFAGAGGLSLGFEVSGLAIAVAAENDVSALQTYSYNRPTETRPDPHSSSTFLADVDLSSIELREQLFESIEQKLDGKRPGILMGGPPCQGYSYAGFRDPTDPRSDLAIAFMDFVERLEPQVVILENVEGLLTAQGGKVVKGLIETLNELGYPVEKPWTLAAEQFGVPQMRRRVFLVAGRDTQIPPPPPVFERCLGRREPAGYERTDAYPITVEEALSGLPGLSTSQIKASPSSTRTIYSTWLTGSHGHERLFESSQLEKLAEK